MTVWKAVQCSTGSRWLQEMARYLESKFAVVVENLAPVTRASDVRYECEYFGPVRRCERDRELRVCLVEFDRCADILDQAYPHPAMVSYVEFSYSEMSLH